MAAVSFPSLASRKHGDAIQCDGGVGSTLGGGGELNFGAAYGVFSGENFSCVLSPDRLRGIAMATDGEIFLSNVVFVS